MLSVVLLGENTPAPFDDHIPPVAFVTEGVGILVPKKTTALFSHTTMFPPATTTGDGLNVILITSDAAKQPPPGLQVSVKSANPWFNSPWLGTYLAATLVLFGIKVPNPPPQEANPAGVTKPFNCVVSLFAHFI